MKTVKVSIIDENTLSLLEDAEKGDIISLKDLHERDIDRTNISDVIKSEYGYHIIIRDKLDDGYLEKLYDSKRENNFLTAIYDEIKDSKIIIQDSFATLRVD